MGVTHGSSVGRLAGPVSVIFDLLSPLQPMGQGRHTEARARSTGAGPAGQGRNRSVGMLHRRHLRGSEKRGHKVGKTKRGKGTKLMAIADAAGLPLAVHTASARPHEVTQVVATVDATVTVGLPERLVGDRAYDSDPLDEKLAADGIELIAPHRRGRVRPATQDGRVLRRYKRRWKIERLFAWLNKYRRILTRWEYDDQRFTGFVHLACSMILLRKYL